MFGLHHKHLLIIIIILLDFLLLLDIYKSKHQNFVLGSKTPAQQLKKEVFLPTLIPAPKPPVLKPRRIDSTLDLLQQINIYRGSKGLSPFAANSQTCFFANLRSQEIISAFNHYGFKKRVEENSLPYSSYKEVAENIAENGSPNGVVPGWINSPPHNEILLKNLPYACVVKNGNFYVFEAWRP